MYYRITRYGVELKGKAVNTGSVIALSPAEGAALVASNRAEHLDELGDAEQAVAMIERDLVAIEPTARVYIEQDFETAREAVFTGEIHEFPESICADLVVRGLARYDTDKARMQSQAEGTAGVDSAALVSSELRSTVAAFQTVARDMIEKREGLNQAIRITSSDLTALRRTPIDRAGFLDVVRADLVRIMKPHQAMLRQDIVKKLHDGQLSFASAEGVLDRENILGLAYTAGPDDGRVHPIIDLMVSSIGKLADEIPWPENARPLATLREGAAQAERVIAELTRQRDVLTAELERAGVIAPVE